MKEVHTRFRLLGGFRSFALRLCIGATAAASLVGCTTGDKQTELENVAKDWSMVIRASQVFPVYPLTEDIQPGDIFLVNETVQRQHELFNQDGFLPLDVHVARLQPNGYESFYDRSFGVGGDKKEVPEYWLAPEKDKEKSWVLAPQAGFPTYQFSVKSGGGFNAALPISGVPVGLTLLGSDAADGSITIDKARTYGIDMLSLYQQLLAWAATPEAEQFIADHKSTDQQPSYLRVISRVYLTGRMIVQLNSAAASSFGASAGAPKPVDLLTIDPNADTKAATTNEYKDGIKGLNDMLAGALQTATVEGVAQVLPGATLKVVAASARSITMAEDFIDRPLVIGYIGFDVHINKRGELGLATRTSDVLNKQVDPADRSFTPVENEFVELRDRLQARPDKDVLAARLAGYIGGRVKSDADKATAAREPVTWLSVGASIAEYIEPEMDSGQGPRLRNVIAAMKRVLSE